MPYLPALPAGPGTIRWPATCRIPVTGSPLLPPVTTTGAAAKSTWLPGRAGGKAPSTGFPLSGCARRPMGVTRAGCGIWPFTACGPGGVHGCRRSGKGRMSSSVQVPIFSPPWPLSWRAVSGFLFYWKSAISGPRSWLTWPFVSPSPGYPSVCRHRRLSLPPGRSHFVPFAGSRGIHGRAGGVSRENRLAAQWYGPGENPGCHRSAVCGCFYGCLCRAHGRANDLDMVLAAAGILQADGWEDKINFLLLGDGPEKARLRLQAEDESLRMVTFRDPVPKPMFNSIKNKVIIINSLWLQETPRGTTSPNNIGMLPIRWHYK